MSEVVLEGADKAALEALMGKREQLSAKTPYFKGLIYGDSGAGKTVAAMKIAQAVTPPGKTIEFIDFLEGWVALLNHPGLTARANRQQYEGLSQLEYLAKFIKMGVEPFDKIGTVILDEWSSMTQTDLDVVLKSRAAKDASKDPNAPTQPDFYANTERSRRAITELMQAHVNVICVGHIREDKLSNGVVRQGPAFMPKFSEKFRQMLHLVANLNAEEFTTEDGSPDYRRFLQVHPTRSISAKTRIGGLPLSLSVEELIPAILEWMRGERAEEPTAEGDKELEAESGIETTGENLVVVDDVVSDGSSEDVAIEVED